ncbi:MAG: esterase [Segetibacter sp.]|nr:esterase [Segetibacter sp.]
MLFVSTNETYSQQKQVLKGTVERIKVHGKGLEGNLSGDSADRSVSIYLPPSYRSNPTRRYPVVYFLHGYTDDDAKWYGFTKHWINLPFIIDSAILKGEAKEMIIVTPNAYSRFQGSWYSNSITTGNWEDFVAKELVTYIDTHYRTIAKASARGISGHSMGGYGALRIGEKHPEVFSSVYLLSPAALKQRAPFTLTQSISRADSTKTYEDFLKADFGTKVIFSEAAAWSPNLNNPPFYVDLPYKNGQLQQDVIDKWTANMPLTTIDQYTTNFKQLKAIAFDAGTKDEAIAASIKVLDEELNKYNIKHLFEIYEGNHTNKIGERIKQKMLPFFSTNLMFEKK